MNMSIPFDLNIKNYNLKELEELFELSANNYDNNLIEQKENYLRNNIINSEIDLDLKNKTILFINEVKNILINNLYQFPNQNQILNQNQNLNQNQKNIIAKKLTELNNTYKEIYNYNTSLLESQTINEGGTNIINQPKTPYTTSYPSEYFQGIINPLHKRILRKNLNIDTRFRNNYYSTLSSNFHLDLPIKLNQVVSLQLSALEFPTSFYAISKVFENNYFVIEVENYEPLLITIPDGNYDYLALTDYINTFLGASSAPYNSIGCLVDMNTPTGIGNYAGSGRMIFSLLTGTIPAFNFALNFLTDKNGNDRGGD